MDAQRKHRVKVSLTKQEAAAVRKAARAEGLSISAYVRRIALGVCAPREKLGTLPSARDVRDLHLRVDFGPYIVDHNPFDQQQNLGQLWRVHGPRDADGCREILDVFDTYREAVADARARARGAFGDDRGDDRVARSPARIAAQQRKAAAMYPAGSEGRVYHETEAARHEGAAA